jgi:ABC-type multidrug transport system fused ATPase/permease subunit
MGSLIAHGLHGPFLFMGLPCHACALCVQLLLQADSNSRSSEWVLLVAKCSLALTNLRCNAGQKDGTVEMRGADFSWKSRAWAGSQEKSELAAVQTPQRGHRGLPVLRRVGASWASLKGLAQSIPQSPAAQNGVAATGAHDSLNTSAGVGQGSSPIYVGLNGSSDTPHQIRQGVVAVLEAGSQFRAIGLSDPSLTLRAPRFRVEPGQLVGICGEVGSGKTSLLAALLGELQPMPPPDYTAGKPIQGAPLVTGSVAYCQQIPWIEAGTVKDNILFGKPMMEAWCAPAVATQTILPLLPGVPMPNKCYNFKWGLCDVENDEFFKCYMVFLFGCGTCAMV